MGWISRLMSLGRRIRSRRFFVLSHGWWIGVNSRDSLADAVGYFSAPAVLHHQVGRRVGKGMLRKREELPKTANYYFTILLYICIISSAVTSVLLHTSCRCYQENCHECGRNWWNWRKWRAECAGS